MKDLDVLPKEYVLEVDVSNDTDALMYVTTEHFRIRNKTTNRFITENEQKQIFPPHPKTNMYIDFVRLRPKISDSIPGESIKLTAEFSLHNAKKNSMYNVVSKCSYGNTIDAEKVAEVWSTEETKLRQQDVPSTEIEFKKKNFYLLDSRRYNVPDSFDFVIQSVGVFDNVEIVKKACHILCEKLIELIEALDAGLVPIHLNETTMEHSFDIILENEDYTIGKVLEYMLYEKYYQTEKILGFSGFKKVHPHYTDSVIRLAYLSESVISQSSKKTDIPNLTGFKPDIHTVTQHLRIVCEESKQIFTQLATIF